nr:small acid-soluble spore protein alpha/beta type [bacterium]
MKKTAYLTPEKRARYEAAVALGYREKLEQGGWGGLSARETGLIGAEVKRRQRAARQ